MPTLLIREASGEEDMRHVRALCRDYRALLADRTADRPDILKTYYDSESYEALLQRLPQMHTAPDGAIFLAFLDDHPVACGMHHRIYFTSVFFPHFTPGPANTFAGEETT